MADTYGGIWIRLIASCIDIIVATLIFAAVVLGMLLCLIAIAVISLPLARILATFFTTAPIIWVILYLLVWLLYAAHFESTPEQGAVGKQLCRLRVKTTEGKQLTYSKALRRNIIKLLLGGIISMVMALCTKKRRAIHDFCGQSVVIRESV
jgi:uncharacterized RDD family membrane protein YckC